MKINQIISETTTAGAIAPVAHSFTKMETRNPSVYGDKKVGSLLKGKKTNKPFANSISEGTEERKRNRQMAQATDYETRAKQTKNDIKKQHYLKMAADIRRGIKTREEEPVAEAKLDEDDIIMIPGQGHKLKPGFHKHDPDKAEHEGQTLKNSLHTIIRVASELDKQLSVQEHFPEWVSEKIGAVKGMMVSVADYLISDEEMEHDYDAMEDGVIAGGIAAEGQQWPDSSNSLAKRKTVATDLKGAPAKAGRTSGMTVATRVDPSITSTKVQRKDSGKPIPSFLKKEVEEGAKVDRMVKHIEKSEKKLGHTKKEAENIAWATANKRGMLDNKNKKK